MVDETDEERRRREEEEDRNTRDSGVGVIPWQSANAPTPSIEPNSPPRFTDYNPGNPAGYANTPALTPDLSGARPSQEATYGSPPAAEGDAGGGDWGAAQTPGPGSAYEQAAQGGQDINIGTAAQFGMDQGPAGSSPRYGVDPNAPPPTSPYAVQPTYRQIGWDQEGGRPAGESAGPAYDDDVLHRTGRPLRDHRFSGPIPTQGSLAHRVEEWAARDFDGPHGDVIARQAGYDINAYRDYLQNAYTPPSGYQRSSLPGAHAGMFEPIPGGPADPRNQPGSGQVPPGWSLHHVGMNRMELGPDTPDNRLADLNYHIQSIQLTQPERQRLDVLNQALAGADAAMHRGDLSPEDAARLKQQIQQQGEDLWAREGTLPEMMEKRRFLMMQKEAAHQQAILAENDRHRQQTAQGRLPTARATMADGTVADFVEDKPGHWTHLPRERPECQERPEITPQILSTARHQQEQMMRQEIAQAARPPQGTIETPQDTAARLANRPRWHTDSAAFEQELSRRHRAHIAGIQEALDPDRGERGVQWLANQLGAGGPTDRPPVAGNPMGNQGTVAPRPFTSDTPVADLTPEQRQARNQFQGLQTRIADLTQIPGEERQRLQMLRAQQQNLFHQFGSVQAMPAAERTQYEETDRQLRAGLDAANRIPRRRWWEAFQVH